MNPPPRSPTTPDEPAAAARSGRRTSPATGARKKDTRKLVGRFALDFAAVRSEQQDRTGPAAESMRTRGVDAPDEANAALLRLRALAERDASDATRGAGPLPVDGTRPNWTPMGPLAVPNGQTYGGARVLISGRVTAIAPHPVDGETVFIGTSRGGVWRTLDGGDTWTPLGDDQPSLAIGALGIGTDDPDVLYAGTGEGNVQLYSTAYALSSAPGVYLGVGVLASADGGASWTHHAASLLANHSFYRIAVDPADAHRAFAATSRGLCRTTDGATWNQLTGGGLPTISGTVIACTDAFIDRGDATGNTVYAAFWGSGIYKSVNALSASPTFTAVTTGLPAAAGISRISLKQSASSPAHRYALIASSSDAFLGLYRSTTAAGTTWELCTNSATIEVYGAFTSDVNVDPTTPDVVYVSGVELYKCRRNAGTGAWTATNIGGGIHPDSHTFGVHPTLNQTIYSGNDGGFFVSRDGGTTWDDSPNEGLCLMQYEAIDNHGSSDAFVQGGTQDNGTQQYRNSPVHYHSADGDGGYCVVSKINGNNVNHAYYSNSPEHSVGAGRFSSYASVAGGLAGNGLFYPPSAISPTSERVAWATTVINIDDAMGTGGWPGPGVALPGLNGRVSAVSFTNDSLIYCATTSGQVYRLDLSGATWAVRALHAAPLPAGQWIWDVHSVPGDANTVVVAYSGFGLAQHVWRGTVPAAGTATWVAVSNGLPDVPMYALAFGSATQWFVGTDIGVYRSTDAGTTWTNFTQGLPNTAIYDLRLRSGGALLRAATHGRGLWELRTDLATQPTVDLFVRDHLMDTGRPPSGGPVAAAWDDPTRYVALNDPCYWWQCADIKADAPPDWQLPAGDANYLAFETRLTHESPEKGNQNRVYVQVHNRGPRPANSVVVRIMTAGASAGLPDLPPDFWSAWPNSPGDANWTAVGAPQTLATLDPLRPTVLRWDWTPAPDADTHTCMLVVIDSVDDPIPASTKEIVDIATLVTTEKRAGLKNLHLVDLLPNALRPLLLHAHGSAVRAKDQTLHIPASPRRDVRISMLLSVGLSERMMSQRLSGLRTARLTAKDLEQLKVYWLEHETRTEESWDRILQTFDVSRQYSLGPRREAVDLPVTIDAGEREDVMFLIRTRDLAPGDETAATFTVLQTGEDADIVGGSTYAFRALKA